MDVDSDTEFINEMVEESRLAGPKYDFLQAESGQAKPSLTTGNGGVHSEGIWCFFLLLFG